MQTVKTALKETFQTLYGIDIVPDMSIAPKPELGEYCINVFPLAKTLGKAPNIISEEVTKNLEAKKDIFVSTSATGGYVNFFLTNTIWGGIFSEITSAKHAKKNETIVVDYIGANVGKPLHIGHICTPSVGQAICNVYRHLGYEVI